MTVIRPDPWPGAARWMLAATGAAGLVLLAIGWYGASGESALANQLVWLNLAIAGLVLAGAGQMLFLLAGRRAVGELRVEVLPSRLAVGAPAVATAAMPLGTPVTVAGSSWYHDPGCMLVAGKALVVADANDGLAPCAVCQTP